MGIYRGAGGTGDAVNDATSQATITVLARDEAIVAKNAAQAAQTAAELAETNAETAATNSAASAAAAALFTPSQTGNSGKYLKTDGTNSSWDNLDISTADISGVLPAVNGGTGQSSYAVGDLVYASTTTALSKLADVATGNVVISGGVGVAPSYGKVALTTHVSGVLPVANGGTGQATANDAFNALAPSQTAASGKYLTTDGTNTSWGTNPLGTVTSVAATVPSVLSISGSPITTSGTLAITYSGTALPVVNGGTGVTTSTGTTNVVLSGSPTIVTPVIAQINDANGNAELKFSAIASAVNQVTIENAATGNPVHISATGTDASIGIHLAPKGASGYINVQGGVDSTKRFMFNPDGGTTNTRTMLSTSQTVDRTLTLPDATDTLVGKATTDTLTNKSISGSTNTFTNIPNSGLTNSAITINGTSTSLGGSITVGTVTSVTGTAPVVSSGGTTPAISMAAATTSVSGYLTSTDWTTFNNKGSGSVTSVSGAGTVNGLTLTGTVTSSGSLTLGGTLDLSSPPAIGATTADAGTFSTLRVNSTLSLAGSTGTSGYLLTSNGASAPTWQAAPVSLPSQTGNNGKYLTTDGTTASWATVGGGAALSNDTSTTSNLYPIFAAAITGTPTTVYTSNAKYLYKPSTGELQASVMNATNGLIVNNMTIATSYTIPTGSSAMSTGPVTVASGQSVTVPSGSRWVVL